MEETEKRQIFWFITEIGCRATNLCDERVNSTTNAASCRKQMPEIRLAETLRIDGP